MEAKSTMSDAYLDLAAGEALAANSTADKAALEAMRAAAGEGGRQLERELDETVARLGAASPYMNPPGDLRGRILQATAPTSFRMEDYRKATGENMRFYKIGFYAAAAFLIAAAMFNIYTRNQYATAYNAQVARANTLGQQLQERDSVVEQMADLGTQQVLIKDGEQSVMRAYFNAQTRQAVLVVPKGLVPNNEGLQLTMPEGNGRVTYQTTLVTVDGGGLKALPGESLARVLNLQDLSPDTSHTPKVAGMPH